jgi:dihydropteroate synthase
MQQRQQIMGILNVTPDSFSDGGTHVDTSLAVDHALRMVADGADVIDVGGESTRPGSEPVPPEEQLRRVLPVVRAVRAALDKARPAVRISVDTSLAQVAGPCLDEGAMMLNDVRASTDERSSEPMIQLAVRRNVPIVLMHMQGTPGTMQQSPEYEDVVRDVTGFLAVQAMRAQHAGLSREQIWLDPGIGFGKTKAHNLTLLAHLSALVALGFPVLLGTSRKRFMGTICQVVDDLSFAPRTPQPRELIAATTATTALGVAAGVRMFRVHDVRENRHAADVAYAIRTAT